MFSNVISFRFFLLHILQQYVSIILSNSHFTLIGLNKNENSMRFNISKNMRDKTFIFLFQIRILF